jgi:drug/metabolite transporter (DMT)-like permease
LGETITAATLLGLAMIIGGILWQQLAVTKIDSAR